MSDKSTPIVATMGIDIGKNSFHVIGLDRRGAIVLRQKWSRSQIEARVANMPPRHRQELVPRRRPRSTRGDPAAAEMVTQPDRGTGRQHAAVPDPAHHLSPRESLVP
jgi:hypothetical protein